MEVQHQILGLRTYTNGTGKPKTKDEFFEKGWGAPSLKDLFENLPSHLDKIPNDEKYNLYFTVAECGGKREFIRQKYIPFDIDHINVAKAKETVAAALSAIGVHWDNTPSVFSGNGVQFFVELKEYFTDPGYFDQNRDFYKACCDKINHALRVADLPGEADTSVFSLARLMRLPGTLNKKPDKPTRMAEILQNNFVAVEFSLREAAGIPNITSEDTIRKWPQPDTQAVLGGCENIKAMLSDPENISEPLWYANASIIGRLGGNPVEGRRLWHEYSSKYSKYSASEADRKLDQALVASNPRTCANMANITGSRCEQCPHYRKLKSAILLVGENYIATKETGFHHIVVDESGKLKKLIPAYDDLLKWFQQQHPYVVNDGGGIYTYTGSHFVPYSDIRVKAFAQKWFAKCDSKKANEFSSLVMRNNVVSAEWFSESIDGKMNFKNGVLDIHSMEFTPSNTKELGFMFTIPYDYDPYAKAPRFSAFLDEVTVGDPDLRRMLLEYGGYCLSNDGYWEHKALLLVGSGANGKSVFLETLAVVADGAYSVVSMRNLTNDQFIADLEGKLFNLSEEGSASAFRETDVFKALTAGGKVMVKTVYQKPYWIRNKAKLVFSCNELPSSKDLSHGFYRRFAIVPFEATFDKDKRDPFLMEKLKMERAGILNMMLASYHEMKKRGYLAEAKNSSDALEEYRKQNDALDEFFIDNLEVLPLPSEEILPNRVLYGAYVKYCDEFNEKPLSRISFFVYLLKKIPSAKSRRTRVKIENITERGIAGMRMIGKNTF